MIIHSKQFMSEQPKTLLITGNMASGKSTVAQALAERLPKSVHLRGDAFRRMIVNGRAEMTFELSAEATRQLRLRYHIASEVAKCYLEEGFTVVYQDIIIGSGLRDVLRAYWDVPLALVVLCPRAEVIVQRERARGKTGYENEEVMHVFDRVLKMETPRLGYWLDSSDLTVPETVDLILAHLSRAVVVNP
jgi:predicted kinase